MKIDLTICVKSLDCKSLKMVLEPDNDSRICIHCDDDCAKITIDNVKETSMYSIIDDLIRSYEVYEKIKW
ncbi:MAG: hypothetical protein QXN26_01350 [Thermoplasmataceae archaeon]